MFGPLAGPLPDKPVTARIVPQKWRNHIDLLVRYGTARKVLNLALSLLAYKVGRTHLTTLPSFLKVEATNRCGINCRFCYASKSNDDYPYDDYRALVEKLQPYLFEVCLHDIGEPLLHDEIARYIAFAHARRIGTIISTSLSVERSEMFWNDLLHSGLDRLVVAIDGVTPEVYRRYRANGDLDLVLRNLRMLLASRTQHNIQMSIDWQMIDFPWNKHQQTVAKEMARRLGCDSFSLIHEEQLPRKEYAHQRVKRSRNCLMPYLMFIVTARNEVRPCCNLYKGLNGFKKTDNLIGDLRRQQFEEVWNSDEIAIIRDRERIHTRDYCAYCQEM